MKNRQNTERSEVQILAYGSKQQGMLFAESDLKGIESMKSALARLQKKGAIQNVGEITGSEVSTMYKITQNGIATLVASLRT
ncbi:MAG: hypothetical protein KGH71_05845 [Candidatus Micrarchaeota archaeon]|nr:hypothetical protein [Candidatus Micrarchaeota archaeon]